MSTRSSSLRCAALVLSTLAALATAACGGPPPCDENAPAAWPKGTLGCAHGAFVVARPGAEFPISTPGLVDEVRSAIETASRLWGAKPDELVSGWTLDFESGWFACITSTRAEWTYGCTYPDRLQVRAAPGPDGCRTGVLIHELGHVSGVNDHSDPRFAVADRLSALCAPAWSTAVFP